MSIRMGTSMKVPSGQSVIAMARFSCDYLECEGEPCVLSLMTSNDIDEHIDEISKG